MTARLLWGYSMPAGDLATCERLGLVRRTGIGDYELTGAGIALMRPHQQAPSTVEQVRECFERRHLTEQADSCDDWYSRRAPNLRIVR